MQLMPNQLIKKIGTTDADALAEHLKSLNFINDYYRAANKRKILPIKHRFVGGQPKKKPVVGNGHRDSRIENFLDKVYPQWDIALAMHYHPGGNVEMHRDATGYGQLAVSVSSTDFVFNIGGEKHDCQRGNIYLFRSKVPHGILPVETDRYALVAWTIDWEKVNVVPALQSGLASTGTS